MKKIKSILLSLAVLAAAVSISSCNKTKKTTSDGIEYTYIKEGKVSPEIGEYVLYNLVVANGADSTFISTYEREEPMFFQYDGIQDSLASGMDQIFSGLKKGDSIAFEAPALKVFGEFNLPYFLTAEDKVKIRIGVIDVMDEENVQKYFTSLQEAKMKKEAEHAEVQLGVDIKIIEDYIAENNLNANRTESGLFYVIEEEGSGESIEMGNGASVDYTGYLMDGTLFDTSNADRAKEAGVYSEQRDQMNGYAPLEVQVGVGRVIPGWDEGLGLLRNGAKAKFLIPSTLAYGSRQQGGVIKPNSILIFDVEIKDVMK